MNARQRNVIYLRRSNFCRKTRRNRESKGNKEKTLRVTFSCFSNLLFWSHHLRITLKVWRKAIAYTCDIIVLPITLHSDTQRRKKLSHQFGARGNTGYTNCPPTWGEREESSTKHRKNGEREQAVIIDHYDTDEIIQQKKSMEIRETGVWCLSKNW